MQRNVLTKIRIEATRKVEVDEVKKVSNAEMPLVRSMKLRRFQKPR